MIYALKLLFPVLVVAGLAWMVLRAGFSALLTKQEYQRAFGLIVAATIVVFLGQSTMLYAIGIAFVALGAQSVLGGGARGKIAAFMLLIMVLPPLTWQVGGIGDINYLLALTGPRILTIVLLTGPALALLGDRSYKREPWVVWIDIAVFAYQMLKILLMVPHSTMTGLLRLMVESGLDVLLPYYVVSRGIRTQADMRFHLSHLALGLAFSAAVGFTEFFIHRNLYSELQWLYAYKWQLTMTLLRGEHLRVQASTPQPIVLAFEMIFALGIWTYLRGRDWRSLPVAAIYGLVLCCLAFTFSRGPWIGGLIFGVCLLGLRRLKISAFVWTFSFVLVACVVLKSFGADQILINALGAVFGSSEADLSSINYRSELLDTALALLKQSPWWGVPNYASQMQALRQGEGIIDLVNSYIAIALDAGVIGLLLYVSPYLLVFRRLARSSKVAMQGADQADTNRFIATFLALMIALLFTIFTTSTYFTMPFLLVLLLALPIARLPMKTETVDLALEMPAPVKYAPNGFPISVR